MYRTEIERLVSFLVLLSVSYVILSKNSFFLGRLILFRVDCPASVTSQKLSVIDCFPKSECKGRGLFSFPQMF